MLLCPLFISFHDPNKLTKEAARCKILPPSLLSLPSYCIYPLLPSLPSSSLSFSSPTSFPPYLFLFSFFPYPLPPSLSLLRVLFSFYSLLLSQLSFQLFCEPAHLQECPSLLQQVTGYAAEQCVSSAVCGSAH